MNLYIVVEGRTSEKKVYPCWIKRINPILVEITDLDDFSGNNYYLISGGGYPNYLDVIDAALEDVSAYDAIDYLVVCVDSEEMTLQEKYQEIVKHINKRITLDRLKIVIQHFCLATWGLSNKVVHKRNPQDPILREYIRLFDTRVRDPELLPNYQKLNFNRAQFAHDYLRRVLREKHKRLSYTKANPMIIAHETYFDRIIARYSEDKHIQSFKLFLDAFSR